MNKWEKFKAWDERLEAEHPILYGLLTAVTGIGATIAMIAWAVLLWAVTK